MTDIKGALKAGSAAVWGASRNRRLVLAILPGVVVATVNFRARIPQAKHLRCDYSGLALARYLPLSLDSILAIIFQRPTQNLDLSIDMFTSTSFHEKCGNGRSGIDRKPDVRLGD
jgi:hypothetical protein